MTRPLLLALLVALSAGAGYWLRGAPAAFRGRADSRDAASREEEREVRALRERVKTLEERLASAASEAGRPPPPAPGPPVPPPGEAPATKGPRYVPEALRESFGKVDWGEAGHAIAQMTPVIDGLAKSVGAGQPLPTNVGDIQKWNGSLVTLALTLERDGVEGEGVNGAFTHPFVVANLAHAALRDAGAPLDGRQEEALAAAATRFLDEDRRRVAGYGEETLAFRRIVEECELKDRFFAELDAIVNERQREILHPEATRGRVALDVFSSGVVWAQFVTPLGARSADELRTNGTRLLAQSLGIEPESTLAPFVDEWVRGFPPGYLEAAPDPLSRRHWFPLERVRIAARRQLALFEAIAQGLPLTPDQRSKLKEARHLPLPN